MLGDVPIGSVRGIPEGGETWAVDFQVDDCDAAAGSAPELRGKSLGDPIDMPDIGWMAEVADPEGTVFSTVLSAPG